MCYIYTFVSALDINDLRSVQIRRHCSLMDMASVYETGGCRFEPCLCQSAPFFCVNLFCCMMLLLLLQPTASP